MKDNIKTPHQSTQQNDFETQWRHRQQWEERAEKSVPDDKSFLNWAEKAQQAPGVSEVNVTPLTSPSNDGLPVAEEVTVESQTIHFVCNNGCSAQDIMSLANKAFK